MSGHLDGPPPGPPDPPYIPGDLGAPSPEEFARRRAGDRHMSDDRSPIEGMMFYRAVCVVCGESPDWDGGEWAATPTLAKGVARDCDWTENEDGTLTCEDCAVSAGSDGEDR